MNFQFINFQKKHEILLVFFISLVLSFMVFGNGISGDFVFDDVTIVQNRGDLTDPSNFFNLFISPYHQNTPKSGLYRPFTMATYSLNHNIFGSSPISFHVVNILIHALNSFLVFCLVNYLFKNRFLSYATFLLFLVHPIHTEAVTSIVGRAELLAFFWSLVTVYFFIKKDLLLSSVSFIFAMFSKEIALMALPIIFYIDWALIKNKFFEVAKRMAVFALPLGGYFLLRYKALGAYSFGETDTNIVSNVLIFVSSPERVFTALKVLVLYAEKLIWPIHLSADYSYNAIPTVKNFFASLSSITGLIMLAGLAVILVLRKTRSSGFGFAAALFLFPYLMISNLVLPVGTIMGERLMYFPSLGFAVASALVITSFLNKGKIYKIAALFLLVFLFVFYGVRTFARNKDWRDSRTLFYQTVKESPNSLITRTALAGLHIRANEWDLAKEQLEVAGKIYENHSHLQNLLGVVADHEGNLALAEERYKKSLELNPDAINSYINLADLYLKQGRLEEAGDNLLKVVDFYATTEFVMRYSYTQIALNKPDKALEVVNKYFGSDLNNPDLSALVGTAYFVKGDYKMALFFLEKALEMGNNALEIKKMIQISDEKLGETVKQIY